jgi:hypothetical protein
MENWLIFFWQYWGLNSGLQACSAGALLFESFFQPENWLIEASVLTICFSFDQDLKLKP